MSLTLSGSINARTRQIVVTGTVPAGIRAGYLFGLDDEVLAFQTFRHQWPEQEDRQTWRVLRGVGGSAAAPHAGGTAIRGARDGYVKAAGLTPPDPFVSGGGTTPDLDAVLDESIGQDIADALLVAGMATSGAVMPSADNPFATLDDLSGAQLTADELAAIQAADSPSASNPFTTGWLHAHLHLSSAQILATDQTEGFDIIATPGAGKAVMPLYISIQLGGTVIYANDDWTMGWGVPMSTATQSANGIPTSFLSTAAPYFSSWAPTGISSGLVPEDLPFGIGPATQAAITGNGGLDVDVWYIVVVVP